MSLFRSKDVGQMLDASTARSGNGLRKTLGPIDLIFLGVGAVLGTGIFVLTGTGALTAGPGLTLSFAIAALACCLAALCYAEFSSAVPVAGSIYSYSYATLGELPAWIIGWDLMLEYGLGVSAISVGWSGYLQSLLSGFGLNLPSVFTAAPGSIPGVTTWFNLPAFCVVMVITMLLAFGVRNSMRFNNAMVVIKLTVVGLVIAVGAFHVRPENWHPFMPMGWDGVFGAAAMIFFAFIGFDAVSSAAEEVKNPKRDLPIGIIGSLLICAVLYMAVAAVVTGIMPYTGLANVANPVSYVLNYAGQTWVAGFIDLGAVVGMTTGILVMTYGQSRIVFAMSRDGLLPSALSKLHRRHGTPWLTTWLVGSVFGLIAALVPLRTLAELINIGTLAAFSMVAIAVVILRRTHADLPRTFRCPWVPVVPAATIAMCLFLMFNLQAITWLAFGIWLAIGLMVYFGYSRRHSNLQVTSVNS
jgi:APA family basic amino acid/polyamine antiporter